MFVIVYLAILDSFVTPTLMNVRVSRVATVHVLIRSTITSAFVIRDTMEGNVQTLKYHI